MPRQCADRRRRSAWTSSTSSSTRPATPRSPRKPDAAMKRIRRLEQAYADPFYREVSRRQAAEAGRNYFYLRGPAKILEIRAGGSIPPSGRRIPVFRASSRPKSLRGPIGPRPPGTRKRERRWPAAAANGRRSAGRPPACCTRDECVRVSRGKEAKAARPSVRPSDFARALPDRRLESRRDDPARPGAG